MSTVAEAPATIVSPDEAEQEYRRLCIATVEGDDPPSVDAVRDACFQCGRSYAEFHGHVATLRARKEALTVLERGDQSAEEMREVERQIEAVQQTVAQVRRGQQETRARLDAELAEAARPLRSLGARLEQLRHRPRQARAAANKVLRDTRHPGIRQAISELEMQAERIEQNRLHLLQQARGRREGDRNLIAHELGPRRDRQWLEREIAELSDHGSDPSEKRLRLLTQYREELRQIEHYEAEAERLAHDKPVERINELKERERDWRSIAWD